MFNFIINNNINFGNINFKKLLYPDYGMPCIYNACSQFLENKYPILKFDTESNATMPLSILNIEKSVYFVRSKLKKSGD